MSIDLSSLSCVVSHALRHEPWLFELELDGAGWVGVDELIVAVRGSGPEWSALDSGLLERMVVESPKQRHEIVGDRIRALYGTRCRVCCGGRWACRRIGCFMGQRGRLRS